MDTPIIIKSALFVPGDRPDLVGKALRTNASALIIDLEDAVNPAHKDLAREQTAQLVKTDISKKLIVRINALETGLTQKDIIAVTKKGLFAIIVPKLARPEEVETIDRMLEDIEASIGIPQGKVKIIPLLESALAVQKAYEIASVVTRSERLFTLAFGAADYSVDMGGDMTPEGAERLYPRARIAVACRAAGLEPPLDTPYMLDIKDLQALEEDARAAKGQGFGGKMCIHPIQVDVVNQVFSPTPEDVDLAQRIISAFEEAEACDVGAIQLDGKFIDIALVKKAQRILAVHRAE